MSMGLTCKICFERAADQENGSQARITPCGHVFCAQCASIWFRNDAPCPVCRHAVAAVSGLIPLYDHDSGIQSPSVGDQSEESISNNGESPNGKQKSSSEKGSPGNREQLKDKSSESKKEKSGEGFSSSEKSGLGSSLPKGGVGAGAGAGGGIGVGVGPGGAEDEDLQVKFVLGKLAERWQHVMVERAKLKVQVAKLEKTKLDLSCQIRSLTEENNLLRHALSSRCSVRQSEVGTGVGGGIPGVSGGGGGGGGGARSSSPGDGCPIVWYDEQEAVSFSGESNCQGFERDSEIDGSSIQPTISPDSPSNGSEGGAFNTVMGSRRPSGKPEEKLAAPKWELGHTFAMHSGPVHGIAVSPAGNLVATASWDHLCRVYDVLLEEEVSMLSGHLLGLYAVKFSPAKRDLVGTVSSDRTCRLWNTDTGECLRVLEGHTDEVNGLSFKQGTHLLATASDDKSSMIWDAEKGVSVTTLKGHRNGVYGVCFQPLGHLIATASFDFTARLWDPRTTEEVQTLRGHVEDVIGVDIDDSGILLATGSDDKTCRVWDLRMGKPLAVLKDHSGEVKRVTFSPFGRLLATTSGDTTVRLFNTSSFECAHILSSHSDHVFDAAWSPTADFLVTASHDRFWKIWQPKVSSSTRSSSAGTNFNNLIWARMPMSSRRQSASS